MKFTYIVSILLLQVSFSFGQNDKKRTPLDSLIHIDSVKSANPVDTVKPGEGKRQDQLEKIKEVKKVVLAEDSGSNEPAKHPLVDTTVMNKYGDLLDDDTAFNKKYPIWKPAVGVLGVNILVFSIDRYIFKYDYSTSVSLETWKHNLQTGWAWDNDRFGINFSGHPYTGALYFSNARSHGYNYFESFPFALEGSIMWEYFGENTLPSYSDLINTSVNGAFLGEVLYRISSNILDDRTTGWHRFSRELFAGIIDPVRGINRLLQGKTFRKTNKEVYQKEPLNVSVFGGVRNVNGLAPTSFKDLSTSNTILNFQLDYGNPFELRKRKAFDFFKLRTQFSFGAGRKILDNVLGYGILFGKNGQLGKLSLLYGGFQYYDYWDNTTFELMAIGFGGGVFTKLPLSKKNNLYTNLVFAGIPLGANSGRSGPDTTQFRDYSYNNGLEGKLETTLVLGSRFTASMMFYYYYMNTYTGLVTKDYGPTKSDVPGYNHIFILKPHISIHLYKSLSLGYEHYMFFDNRYDANLPPLQSTRTENKIYLLFYFEDPQRKGHYE